MLRAHETLELHLVRMQKVRLTQISGRFGLGGRRFYADEGAVHAC